MRGNGNFQVIDTGVRRYLDDTVIAQRFPGGPFDIMSRAEWDATRAELAAMLVPTATEPRARFRAASDAPARPLAGAHG
eukprot:3796970-Alexandrium_andersonii.AAC.1